MIIGCFTATVAESTRYRNKSEFSSSTKCSPTGIAPTVLIKQKLDLIQFAIDQQQLILQDQLNQLQQSLIHYEIVPALQHSLNQSPSRIQAGSSTVYFSQNQRHQLIDDITEH